jgi:hypothetical protein
MNADKETSLAGLAVSLRYHACRQLADDQRRPSRSLFVSISIMIAFAN